MIQQPGIAYRLRQIDYLLAASVIVIAAIGTLAIRSATHGLPAASIYMKQAEGAVVGAVIMLAVGLIDYETVLPRIARPLYYFSVLLLAVVLKFHGHSSHGAQRWIPIGHFEFQPSEFAKIAVIISLALYLSERRERVGDLRTVIGSLLVIALPFLLIIKQPDLGTGLVIVTMWAGMVFVAGAQPKHLLAILLAGVMVFAVAWRFNVIKGYQRERLASFVSPNIDPANTGYHLHESQIAIGAGQLTGQGYEHGIQARGHFIPEQQTDFIFTIIGEEGGFVSCVILLMLYLFCLERGVVVIMSCEDYLGRLLAAGVVSMLAFHIIVNVGMTIGVMPVVGVPLPFASYGLSALLVDMFAMGLLLSVAARRRRSLF